MAEQYTNTTGYLIDIPRFNLRVPPGATFTVPDEDAGSLSNNPIFTTDGIVVRDNEDGTLTLVGTGVADNGDGTLTLTPTDPSEVVDNGDGTLTIG